MTRGKAIVVVVVLALTVFGGARFAEAAEASAELRTPQEAARFVESLGNQAVTLLAERGTAPEQRQAALRELIRNGFNLELTSQFVLGKFWSRASDEQRAEFKDLFAEYLLNSYVRHLGSFRAETLTILATHAVNERDVLVETSIDTAEGATKPVWRVRAQDDGYWIIDVSVEGVSMALTQRREFASVVNRRGLDGLLDMLREKLAEHSTSAHWDNNRPGPGAHISLLASVLASPNMDARVGVLLALR